jgi:hypothetical protein
VRDMCEKYVVRNSCEVCCGCCASVMIWSVCAGNKINHTCKFMYASTDIKIPLYSMPHFNLTITALLVSSFKKGFGFTGTVYP